MADLIVLSRLENRSAVANGFALHTRHGLYTTNGITNIFLLVNSKRGQVDNSDTLIWYYHSPSLSAQALVI